VTGESLFSGRTIVVTGGTGSIGSAIVDALLPLRPQAVRVVSRDDSKQFELAQRWRNEPALRLLIGDVRSRNRMTRALAGADLVFHAAAMKHVPASEFNPFEATETNVRGTQNVVEAAIDAGVERMLTISTDKAVDPNNVMGATKLLAERLMSAAESYKGPSPTRFASVRFGNVIGSRGSLVPLVRQQVMQGGPVTITDPEMTRYFMPIDDAVQLCLEAMARLEGGEIFILRMPRVRVGDLVEVLIETYAPQFGYRPADIEIETIGVRSGEKANEVLMTASEAQRAHAVGPMYVVPARLPSERATGAKPVAEEPELLDRVQIRELLDRAGWLAPDSPPMSR
jgi:UDP-N-acetylglucosamine 4,6-dehydratase